MNAQGYDDFRAETVRHAAQLMAGAAIMTIPVLALFAAAQRYFVSGVVMSGLKL